MNKDFINTCERGLYRICRPGRAKILSNKIENSLAPFNETRSIFVHIPKTAGISVRTALYNGPVGYHMSLRDYYLSFSRESYLSYFKFTFIRNPWDRLYSAFRYLSGPGCTPTDRLWWNERFDNVSFNDFICNHIKHRGVPECLHFASQVTFLSTSRFRSLSSKTFGINFIGLYENLASDFAHIRRRLKIDNQLNHLNPSTKQSQKPYTEFYTPEMIRVAAKVYAADIQTFGYSFDNSNLSHQLSQRDSGKLGLY
jgi:hypothetical protein